MGERHFRLLLGMLLLAILYLDWRHAMMALIAYLLFEGITNLRLPLLVSRWRYGIEEPITQQVITGPIGTLQTLPDNTRIGFEAERVLRILLATILVVSYFLYNDLLWSVPWFFGITLLGAGLSGICPTLVLLKKLGFK